MYFYYSKFMPIAKLVKNVPQFPIYCPNPDFHSVSRSPLSNTVHLLVFGPNTAIPKWRNNMIVWLVKNLPAMRETWVGSLGWEDPLGKGKATHSNIPAWRIPWTVWGRKELDTTEQHSRQWRHSVVVKYFLYRQILNKPIYNIGLLWRWPRITH